MSHAELPQGYQPPSSDRRLPGGRPVSGPAGEQPPAWMLPVPQHAAWETREHAPDPRRSPGTNAKRIGAVVVAVVLLGGAAYYLLGSSSESGFDVKVTACRAAGSMATVGLEVHNRGSSTQTATI